MFVSDYALELGFDVSSSSFAFRAGAEVLAVGVNYPLMLLFQCAEKSSMSHTVLLSPQGVFPDVCLSAWGFTVAYKQGKSGPLVVQRRDINGGAISGDDISTGMEDSTFARVCSALGKTWVAYRAFRHGQESAVVREVRQDGLGDEHILGPTFGNNPVCLSSTGLVAWQGHGLAVVHGLRLEDGQTIILRTETRPTGIAHLNGDHPVFVDENRLSEPGMLNPVRSGALTVGEGPVSGLLAKIQPRFGQILGGECFVPRCADLGEDRYAAVTWGPGVGATLVIFEPADIQPITEVPVEPIPDVNRKLWFGAYDRDQNGTFPSNCRIRWSPTEPAVLETLDGKDLAYYVSGVPDGDPEAIELACVAAKLLVPKLPVLAYVPGGVPFPPSADWIGLEAYHKTWETLQHFELAIRSRASQAARPVVLIGQCYTSNAHNTKELRPLVPVFGRFLRDVSNCIGFVAFSAGHWRATGFEDHPEVHGLYQQLSRTIQTPDLGNGGGGGGTVDEPVIAIIDYDKKVSRRDPKGCLIRFDVSSEERIVKVSCQMEGDGEPPVAMHFTDGPDGRYVRALAFKPVRTGKWFPLVKAWDESGRMGMVRGATKVEVTEGGSEEPPPPSGDLEDQKALVAQVRKELFPDKFQPGHPQANPEGFLPLHDLEKAALWAKHVAWRLRSLGVGMVKAKPGSANHGGANSISAGGYTTDIVATADGVHWDFQIDGAEGAAFPTWAKEEDASNYPPVASRWVPAFDPSTP